MKTITSLILSMALIFVSCEFESQPTQNTPNGETQSLNKRPPKGEKSELITFSGDLSGSQEVVNCCPNAGPFPEYTMTLSGPLPSGTYDGNIFMNKFGHNLPWAYKVQFWWTENNIKTFIEVRGGVVQEDKKNKVTTVTFTNELCEILVNNKLTATVQVTFTLVREPQ